MSAIGDTYEWIVNGFKLEHNSELNIQISNNYNIYVQSVFSIIKLMVYHG